LNFRPEHYLEASQEHIVTADKKIRPSVINGLKLEEMINIPKKVIRESLVNAVCHRDYSIANREITVYKEH